MKAVRSSGGKYAYFCASVNQEMQFEVFIKNAEKLRAASRVGRVHRMVVEFPGRARNSQGSQHFALEPKRSWYQQMPDWE